MLSMLLSGLGDSEEKQLVEYSKMFAKQVGRSLDEVKHAVFEEDAYLALDGLTSLDIAIVDITNKWGVEFAKEIRGKFQQAEILIIADGTISPIQYLNPMIKASALLLRPYDAKFVKETLVNFISIFAVAETEKLAEEFIFPITKKGVTINIMLDTVFYFEARAKKLFIRAIKREYEISDSLDNISTRLPAFFMRCHRSFIVNELHIHKIVFPENSIFMKNKEVIPISRSYKNNIKVRHFYE